MSTRNALPAVALLMLGAGIASAPAAEGPQLGAAPSPATIAAADFSIAPDGAGLPAGSGTAVEGQPVFAAKCAACHGENGRDGMHDRLVGGHGSLATARPVKTLGSFWPYATTVFDYVRRTMPYYQPRTLSDNEVYALTAYLLYLNGIVGRRDVLNATTLPAVKMPNRDGFVWTADVPPPR